MQDFISSFEGFIKWFTGGMISLLSVLLWRERKRIDDDITEAKEDAENDYNQLSNKLNGLVNQGTCNTAHKLLAHKIEVLMHSITDTNEAIKEMRGDIKALTDTVVKMSKDTDNQISLLNANTLRREIEFEKRISPIEAIIGKRKRVK